MIIPSVDDPLMTVDEIASIFSVSKYTVREWLRDGKMKGTKIPGGEWRVQHSEMVRFANEKYGE